jgi:hypothetical protein
MNIPRPLPGAWPVMNANGSTTRRPMLLSALGVALLLAVSSCASGTAGDNPFDRRSGTGDNVALTIENRNFNDATIYAHWGGSGRIRVGRVTGNGSETFELEWRGGGQLRIEADFLAGGGYMSDPISVSRGDHLELILR